jgi:hypothetical protein
MSLRIRIVTVAALLAATAVVAILTQAQTLWNVAGYTWSN